MDCCCLLFVEDFGMGTILASFQTFGKRPFEIERLTSFASDGAILGAVDFSMRPEMPSRPLALLHQHNH